MTFEKELEDLINRYSMERHSNTPDFLLAEYLTACLAAYSATITKRDKWFNFEPWPANKVADPQPDKKDQE